MTRVCVHVHSTVFYFRILDSEKRRNAGRSCKIIGQKRLRNHTYTARVSTLACGGGKIRLRRKRMGTQAGPATQPTQAEGSHDMRWAPLAACWSYASCLVTTAAFTVVMPAASGMPRALFCSSGCRTLYLSRVAAGHPRSPTMALPLRLRLPPVRPAARHIFQQRMMSSSTSQHTASEGTGSGAAAAPIRGKVEKTVVVATAAKRRASSRYIPSDFRGVRGGPKGKWKARLVSKGQLRQLGTFE